MIVTLVVICCLDSSPVADFPGCIQWKCSMVVVDLSLARSKLVFAVVSTIKCQGNSTHVGTGNLSKFVVAPLALTRILSSMNHDGSRAGCDGLGLR